MIISVALSNFWEHGKIQSCNRWAIFNIKDFISSFFSEWIGMTFNCNCSTLVALIFTIMTATTVCFFLCSVKAHILKQNEHLILHPRSFYLLQFTAGFCFFPFVNVCHSWDPNYAIIMQSRVSIWIPSTGSCFGSYLQLSWCPYHRTGNCCLPSLGWADLKGSWDLLLLSPSIIYMLIKFYFDLLLRHCCLMSYWYQFSWVERFSVL